MTAAFVLAVARGDGMWIGALIVALLAAAALLGIGGPLRSAGSAWYGVELPVALRGVIWTVLGVARRASLRFAT